MSGESRASAPAMVPVTGVVAGFVAGVVAAGEDPRDGTDPEVVEPGALTGVLEHEERSITERARDSEPNTTTRRAVVTRQFRARRSQRVGVREPFCSKTPVVEEARAWEPSQARTYSHRPI